MGKEAKANGDVRHLDHFVVPVMDATRAEKFYTDVLGARTLKYENSPGTTRVFMKLGANHVGLFSQGQATLPNRESVHSFPRHSFQIPAGAYDSMLARVRRAGAFARDIKSELGASCTWTQGIVFKDSEGNFFEISAAGDITEPRLHHLHFDTIDLKASVDFYRRFLNCDVLQHDDAMAAVAVPSGQCIILNQVGELSEVTKSSYRGRHFAFAITDDNFRAFIDKLRGAGIAERDDHGERAGRRSEQLATYFSEPSGFRLQVTNEDSATFAEHATR
jgi:catechol 2,3-dioxygenase-like lactoylglutathione lyase family enzyme